VVNRRSGSAKVKKNLKMKRENYGYLLKGGWREVYVVEYSGITCTCLNMIHTEKIFLILFSLLFFEVFFVSLSKRTDNMFSLCARLGSTTFCQVEGSEHYFRE